MEGRGEERSLGKLGEGSPDLSSASAEGRLVRAWGGALEDGGKMGAGGPLGAELGGGVVAPELVGVFLISENCLSIQGPM